MLRRVGQTEAAVDLAELAGFPPVGVICEILNTDGTMARRPELHGFAAEHGLKFITVAQLVAYRLTKTRLVSRVAEAELPAGMRVGVQLKQHQLEGLAWLQHLFCASTSRS